MLTRLNRAWIDLPLRGKGLIVVTIPLVALLIGAASFTLVARQQRSANAWVQHSLLVRNVAGKVRRDQTEAAASGRAYLLTGDTADLGPARLIERDVPATLTQLETLVQDNPAQLARAHRIDALSRQQLADLAGLQSTPPEAAGTATGFDVSLLDDDQATLDRLRDEVNAFLGQEDQLLGQRTSRASRISDLGMILTGINLLIGLAGGLAAVGLFTTGIVRRVKHLEAQRDRLEANELLLPPSSSADELGRFERSLSAAAALLSQQQNDLKTANDRLTEELAERARAEETISQLNRRNELILNAAGDGILGTDVIGRTIFVNPMAARLLGYRPRELLGTPSPLEGPVAAALDGAIRHVADEEFVRRDGTRFPVEYASTPIREQGAIVGAVVTFKDITERRVIERMKTDFVSTVSHELRTPLTSIRGSLGLLTGGVLGPLAPEVDRMLQIAVSNTDRLIRLINDILDIERLESGKVELARQECDLSALIDQTLSGMRGMAAQAGVTLSVSATAARFQADPDRVIQTLTNLLGNAIKFSPEGSTVWLRVARVQNDLLFSVRDEGRGIPRDKIVSIFERFSQVDASDARNFSGTGLGLAICRSIVEQHGGRIWAESDGEGLGSTFFFTLPLAVGHPSRRAGKPRQVTNDRGSGHGLGQGAAVGNEIATRVAGGA